MAEENQTVPLAPARTHPRSDEESATAGIFIKPKTHEKSSKLLVYVLAGIVIVSAILLVLGSIVLRPSIPRVRLSSVAVRNLVHGNSTFNATLVTELTIKNNNFGSFRFHNSTGGVFYGGVRVGVMRIREGIARARRTERVSVTVDVRSNQFVEARNLSSDLNSGALKLSSDAELHGRLNLFDIVKRKRRPQMSCDMTLLLRTKSIEDLVCD